MASNTLEQGPVNATSETSDRNTEWKRLVERAVALEAQLYGAKLERAAAEDTTSSPALADEAELDPFQRPRFSSIQRNLAQLERESGSLLQLAGSGAPDRSETRSQPTAEHARAHALLAQCGFDPDRLDRQAAQVRLVEDLAFLETFAETDLETWLRLQHECAVLELCESARQRTDASSESLWEQYAATSWDQRRRQLLSLVGGGAETFNLRSALSTPISMSEPRSRRDRLDARAKSSARPSDESLGRLTEQYSRPSQEPQAKSEHLEQRSIFEKESAALVMALVRQSDASRSASEERTPMHASRFGSVASPVGSSTTSVTAALEAETEPLVQRLARAAHKWSHARSASSWPYISYAEACYDILCAVLGTGVFTWTEQGPASPAGARIASERLSPFKLPAEGLIRPARGHRLRFVCGALDWLQKQFHLFKLRPALAREPETAALGGEHGTLAEVRAYLRVIEASSTVASRPTGWLTENPFAEIYFCLRCGDLTAAVEASRDWLSPDGHHYSGDDLPRFLSYLEAFERDTRRRFSALKHHATAVELSESQACPERDLGGVRGTLNQAMLSQMIQDYALLAHRMQPWQGYRDLSLSLNPNAHEEHRRSVEREMFKRICYVLVGRLNSTASGGMELLDMDYDVLFASIEDYLWMRLWTCRLREDEWEAEVAFTCPDRHRNDDSSLFGESLSSAMQPLELRLEHIQDEMQQFGPLHFDPHGARPHFYAMILLLTGQFEPALAYLVQCGLTRMSAGSQQLDPLMDAVHLGLILNYYGVIDEVVQPNPDLVLYDYAAILWRYLQRERDEVCIAKSDPAAAAAYLMTIRDAEQRFSCLCNLVMTTRAFSLLLGAMIPGTLTHRPGLVERLEHTAYTTRTSSSAAEWARVAYACAESCEIAGDVVHAAMLFELAGDVARVLSLLIRSLCATYLDNRLGTRRTPQTADMESSQNELAKQAQAFFEKYEREGIFDRPPGSSRDRVDQNHTFRRLRRSLEVALELARFFTLVYGEDRQVTDTRNDSGQTSRADERYEAALELQRQLGLVPLSRSELPSKLEALRPGENYEEAILERLPAVLLAFMQVIQSLYETTRQTLRTLALRTPDQDSVPSTKQTSSAWRARLEQRLQELKEIAHTLVTFSGLLTYTTPADTAELVRLEMTLT